MNKTIMIIMGVAVVIALIVAVLVSSTGKKKPVEVTAAPVLEVLVANKVLLKGEPLKAEDVTWQPWHDDISFTGLIKKSEQADPAKLTVYGSLLLRNLESGEPVTTQSLVDAKGSFMSAMIDPGMRAVSVAVRGESGGAGGFISPGDQVDVILAYTVKLTGPAQNAISKVPSPKYAIQVVLRDIKVLAVDQNAKDDAHDPKIAKSVTLEVDEAGAEKLALAQQLGEISLALRRLGEKDSPDMAPPPMVTDINSMDVIKNFNDYAEQAQSADGAETGTFVRVYSGNSVQNVPVRQTSAPSSSSQ